MRYLFLIAISFALTATAATAQTVRPQCPAGYNYGVDGLCHFAGAIHPGVTRILRPIFHGVHHYNKGGHRPGHGHGRPQHGGGGRH